MIFFLLAVAFMYVGRKLGWTLSRAVLYTAPAGLVVALCIGWGLLVAFAIRELLNWQQPGVILRWLFGYWLGAYVAVPNFGLFSRASITPEARGRHNLVSNVSMLVYIVASVALAYTMPYGAASVKYGWKR